MDPGLRQNASVNATHTTKGVLTLYPRKDRTLFDRNTLFAFLLIAVILILMPYYQEFFGLVPPVAVEDSLSARSALNDVSGSAEPSPTLSSVVPSSLSFDSDAGTAADTLAEKRLVIENDLFFMTLSNRGGGTLEAYIFKEYKIRDGHRNILLPSDKGNLGIEYLDRNNETVSLNDRVFSSAFFDSYSDGDTVRVQNTLSLTFDLQLTESSRVRKSFQFLRDSYAVEMELLLDGFQYMMPDNQYSLFWDSGIALTEERAKDDLAYSYVYSRVGDEIIDLHLKDKPEELSMSGDVNWVSVRSKYFAAILIPRTEPGKSVDMSGHLLADESRDQNAVLNMTNRNGLSQLDRFTFMITPLSDEYLESFGIGLEKIMNWGWVIIRPISFAILYTMKFLHSFIPNYGLVLLILTFIIKILLYPLTHKSYESMKRMSEIQPLMKEVQEKYKKNPEQMNKEVMALYKKHNVNPLGGCLPMLLQMPLLYGLFIVFRTTIELRNEPFFWWIRDLSAPDVIYTLPFSLPLYGDTVAILPVFMGLTMIFQQKLSTASAVQNEQQKILMYVMPVFLILIFNQFPSGLNLYYGLFNLLTILQQKYFINPSIKPLTAHSEAKRKNR